MWLAEEDRLFALRLARYCARNVRGIPSRSSASATIPRRHRSPTITYRSDKTEGPTAGSETVDALEFLARLVAHIPDPGQVL